MADENTGAGLPPEGAGGNGAGDSGVQTTSWLDSLQAEDRALAEARSWDTPDKAISSYRSLESLRGVPADRLLTIPSADADPSAWDSVYQKLGAKSSPDEYKIELPPDAPIDQNRVKGFQEIAHKARLTQAQVEALAEWDLNMAKNFSQQSAEELANNSAQEQSDLKREWGQAYDKRLGMAKVAAQKFGATEDVINNLESQMGYKKTMEFFARIADATGTEDTFETGQQGSGFSAMTPQRAQQEITDLMSDKDFRSAYLSGSKSHIERIDRLQGMAHGK